MVIMEERRFTSSCGMKVQHNCVDYNKLFEGFPSTTLCERGGGIVEKGGGGILFW